MRDRAEAAERIWITRESTTLEGSRLAAQLVEVGAVGQLVHVLLRGGIRNRPEKNWWAVLELTAAEVESVLPADREAPSRRRTHDG